MSAIHEMYLELRAIQADEDYLRDSTIIDINCAAYSVDKIQPNRDDNYYNKLCLMPRTEKDALAQGTQFAGVVYNRVEPITVSRRRSYRIGARI